MNRRGGTDLTLLTGEQYMDYGEVVRHEQLVWVAPRHQLLHEETPLPLAMFQADCIFRRHAFQSLAAQGRDYRVAYQSASTAGILAAVSAGLAMTVLAESVVPDGFRIAGAEEGLPALPMAPVILATRPAGGTAVVKALAGFIREAMQATRGRSGVNPAVS
ncbi:MAG: hypothetical protein KYX62_06830 [Pseudomonadota bacterium]|nr:hypothetical protein [Pseudomonadota bacterium]